MHGKRLYHFLRAEHALLNVEHRQLKVSRIDQLNDPFEFLAVDLSDPGLRWLMTKGREQQVDIEGIVCFCDNWRTPVMWAYYADCYAGICLGFDVNAPDESLVPMKYVPDRLKPPARQYDAAKREEWQSLFAEMMAIKFDHWRYEGEYRLHVALDTPDSALLDPLGRPLYFVDFAPHMTLREVIVGYRSATTKAAVKAALGPLAASVDVFRSRPSNRDFSIVRDKKPWK